MKQSKEDRIEIIIDKTPVFGLKLYIKIWGLKQSKLILNFKSLKEIFNNDTINHVMEYKYQKATEDRNKLRSISYLKTRPADKWELTIFSAWGFCYPQAFSQFITPSTELKWWEMYIYLWRKKSHLAAVKYRVSFNCERRYKSH